MGPALGGYEQFFSPNPMAPPPSLVPFHRPMSRSAARSGGFDMTQDDPKGDSRTPQKERDKYGGMVDFDLDLTPSVIICAAAGAVLGFILAWWGTSEISIIAATVIVFAVLSGIFGFFVPWYKPR